MNTIRSVYFGWGVLIVAGGGAYYFAKRSINSDRAERAHADRRRRETIRNLEYQNLNSPPPPPAAPAPSSSSSSSVNTSPKNTRRVTEEVSRRREGRREGGGEGEEDLGSSPSSEASQDPAPTRHAPETEGQRVGEKSKYEASEPWRSRKGDRFS